MDRSVRDADVNCEQADAAAGSSLTRASSCDTKIGGAAALIRR